MVHVATASGPFHARVIAARLGAAGILCEVRGGLDGPYPLAGPVDVMAPDEEADEARALLAADAAEAALVRQIDSAFEDWAFEGEAAGAHPARAVPSAAYVMLFCLLAITVVGVLAGSAARLLF
jgi:hypothetical protein